MPRLNCRAGTHDEERFDSLGQDSIEAHRKLRGRADPAGSPVGWAQALVWIMSKKEIGNIAGWAAVSATASLYSDEELDLDEYQSLLAEVERTIHSAKDAVQYNEFVCDFSGKLYWFAHRPRDRGGASDRHIESRHGRYKLRRAVRPGLYPKSESSRKHWKETQICHVLNTVAPADSLLTDHR